MEIPYRLTSAVRRLFPIEKAAHAENNILPRAVAVAVAYFVAAIVARLLKQDPFCASFLWPGSGLLLGALLISPRREWLILLLASLPFDFVLNAWALNLSFPAWLVSRAATLFAVWLGATAIVWACRGLPRFDTVREVAIVVGVGTFLCEPLNGLLFALTSTHLPSDVPPLFYGVSWYVANMVGFALLTPAIVVMHHRKTAKLARRPLPSAWEFLAVALAYVVLLRIRDVGGGVGAALMMFGMLAGILWAAVRAGSLGVVAANAVVILGTAIFPIRLLSSPTVFVGQPTNHELAIMAVGVTAMALAGVLVAVLIEAQRYSQRLLEETKAQLEAALSAKEQKTEELRSTSALLTKVLARSESMRRDLATANDKLTQSNRDKLDFVRTLSHELRNPIAGARLMADSLLWTASEEERRRQVDNLGACVRYLGTLLDETMDLAQAEAGQVAVKVEPFTVSALLEQVAGLFRPVATEKGLSFEVIDATEASAVLFGDKIHAKRILANYLSNAFKFTRQGRVTLRVCSQAHESSIRWLRFEVSDTGPGVSPAVQRRLFQRFIRGIAAEDAPEAGAGLGLALCRQLADLAGGRVGYHAGAVAGCVFWAELPFLAGSPPPAPGADEDGEASLVFPGITVALIDDDPARIEVMGGILEQLGVSLRLARSAPAAVELLSGAEHFALVFVAHGMIERSGESLLSHIRTRPDRKGPAPQFHLMVLHGNDSLAEGACALGFTASHQLPVSLAALYRLLDSVRPTARV